MAVPEAWQDRQEEWAERFFTSNPHWQLDGDRPRLRSGTMIADLVEDTKPEEPDENCNDTICEAEEEPEGEY